VEVHKTSGEVAWALVHIEVQSQVDHKFLERMFTYYLRIYDHHRKPVSSLAVLGDTQAGWRPIEFQRELWGTKLNFSFPSVKLLDYHDRLPELETSNNPFALLVASTLHTHQTKNDPAGRRIAKFRLVRGLFERGLGRAQIRAFFRLIDWIMTLPDNEQNIFDQDLEEYERKNDMPFITSIERKGLERGLQKGLEQGLEQGRRDSIGAVLEARFGLLPRKLLQRLEQVHDREQLLGLTKLAATTPDLQSFEVELCGESEKN
jgi:hypothetical protein